MQDIREFAAPRRWALVAAIVIGIAVPGLLRADEKADPSQDPPTVRLVVSPSAEPVPALKYQLLPPADELKRGNAALAYDRAIIAFHPSHSRSSSELRKFYADTLDHWLEMPISQLPLNEVEKRLDIFHPWIEGVERGALFDRCDWGLPLDQDGFGTLIPEIQEMRTLAKLAALKGRLALARDDFDGAVRTFAANFKLARNLCEGRLLISCVVGAAVANLTAEQVEAFVQRATAPSLYWALTDLPVPLIDMRTAIQTENMTLDYQFPELRAFKKHPLSREEAARLHESLIAKWVKLSSNAGGTREEALARFAAAAMRNYTEDKRTLAGAGWKKSEVDAMAVVQVIWLASYRRIEVLRNDFAKWAGVSPSERRAGMNRVERTAFRNTADYPFELTQFMYAGSAVFEAANRTDRKIALLRIVEALRLYARDHQARLPDRLDMVRDVPIPVDPLTGKPFAYRLDGPTAVLETLSGPTNKYNGRRYIISLRK